METLLFVVFMTSHAWFCNYCGNPSVSHLQMSGSTEKLSQVGIDGRWSTEKKNVVVQPSEFPVDSRTGIDLIHFWCRSGYRDIKDFFFLTFFNIATFMLIYQGNYLDLKKSGVFRWLVSMIEYERGLFGLGWIFQIYFRSHTFSEQIHLQGAATGKKSCCAGESWQRANRNNEGPDTGTPAFKRHH